MVIRKTIFAITIASLITQPILSSGTIIKSARLEKISKLVRQNENVVGNFIKSKGFKAKKGGYYAPAVIQAVKNEFATVVPTQAEFQSQVTPIDVQFDTWLPKTEIIADSETDELASNIDTFACYDAASVDSTIAQPAELVEWYATQYSELNQKTLSGVKHAVEDYLAIAKDAASVFNFGNSYYNQAGIFTGNQLADQIINALKTMTKSFKNTMDFVAVNVRAENKDIQAFLINPYINQFNSITADAIRSFEGTKGSEVAAQTFIATMRAAYRSLVNNLNKVNDLLQKKAADFTKVGKEYVTQATTYVASNPKKAHALFATTVASVTGRAMASAQEKEKAAKKVRLAQAATIAAQDEATRFAAIPTIENIATAVIQEPVTQPSVITPTEVVVTESPIVIDHELEEAKRNLAEADRLYAAQLEINKLNAAQSNKLQKLYGMLPNNPIPTIKQAGTKVVNGVKACNPAKYVNISPSIATLSSNTKAIKEAGLSAINWISNLRPSSITKMLGYSKVDEQKNN